jgi:hypothetical protein
VNSASPNSRLPLVVSPALEPKTTATWPVSASPPASCHGIPIARSSKPSPFQSPQVCANPKRSSVFGVAGHPRDVLMQERRPRRIDAQLGRAPVEHRHGARGIQGADVLARDTDREVGEAVAIEVLRAQRRADDRQGARDREQERALHHVRSPSPPPARTAAGAAHGPAGIGAAR